MPSSRPTRCTASGSRPWELGPGDPVAAQVLLDADIARSVLNEDPGLRSWSATTTGRW